MLEPRESRLPISTVVLRFQSVFGWQAIGERSGHSGLLVFVILLLLIVGGVVLQQRYEPSLWQRVRVTVRERYDALLEKMIAR